MPLPSFYGSDEPARPWRVSHAAAYGALVGALAALFKMLGPLSRSGATNLTRHIVEIALAAFGFAVLCVLAAMLRNFVARRLIWHDARSDRTIDR